MGNFRRDEAQRATATTRYDVVVIGAGMTGAGVALDAATRGLKVALIDLGDFGSGTSSKSSKMVHGGLRYLQEKEFRLVYENLRERQRLLKNAPFLVRPLPILIPLFGRNGVLSKVVVKGYSTALWIYDITGGWRIGKRHHRITKAQAMAHLPTLNGDSLVAGFLYLDARGDDARVALTLARTAALNYGVDALNYVRATHILHRPDAGVTDVVCVDELNGSPLTLSTSTVVNATGVWADDIFAMAENAPSHRITPAKGVHVSVPRHRLPADVAAVLHVAGDRRSIFIVPFDDAPYTFIGTTDTAYVGANDSPQCTPEDIQYLLDAVNASTSASLTTADVTGLWVGLRPLLAPPAGTTSSVRTADLSRRHQVTDTLDGVIHVTGGKWTTYRQMAEDTVDALAPYFPSLAKVQTRNLRLHGYGTWQPATELAIHLYRRFGVEALDLLAMIEADPSLGRRPISDEPYVGAEFVHSVRNEMATSLIDLLTRRTRAHLHNARACVQAAPQIARLVAQEFGWSDEEIARQVEKYRTLAATEFAAAGLSL